MRIDAAGPTISTVEFELADRDSILATANAAIVEAGELRVRDLRLAYTRAQYAADLFESVDHPEGLVQSHIMIAWCQCDEAHFEQSYAAARLALQIALASGLDDGVCAAYLQLGITACQAGDLLDSVEYLETSLEQARQCNASLLRVRALSNLAAVYGDFKDYDRALALMHEVFMLLSREPININVNVVESNYGGFLLKKAIAAHEDRFISQFAAFAETAQHVLEPVVARMRDNGDTLALPRSLNNLGKVYALRKLHVQQAAVRAELKAYATSVGTEQANGLYFEMLGYFARFNGNWGRSARCYAVAARLFSRLNSKTLAHNAHVDASFAYEKCSKFEQAYFNLRSAVDLERKQQANDGAKRSQALSVKLSFEKARHENEILRVRNDVLNERAKELEVRANYDGLTGILNRQGLEDSMNLIHRRVKKEGVLAYIAVLDVDHFKLVNDTHGHLVGDEVLRRIADRMTSTMRSFDIVGRLGGEEFLLVTEQESLQMAQIIFARVHAEIRDYDWSRIAPGLAVTASVGATSLDPKLEMDSVLQIADDNLYAAKRTGRNRIVWSGDAMVAAA